MGQVWPRWAKIAPTLLQQSPKIAQDRPKMSQDGPNRAQDSPRCLCRAVLGFHLWLSRALPGFAFALLLHCLCFALPFPFPFEWGGSPKLSTKQEPTTIDTNAQVDDRKHVGEAWIPGSLGNLEAKVAEEAWKP